MKIEMGEFYEMREEFHRLSYQVLNLDSCTIKLYTEMTSETNQYDNRGAEDLPSCVALLLTAGLVLHMRTTVQNVRRRWRRTW
jgi:hypothetical protein